MWLNGRRSKEHAKEVVLDNKREFHPIWKIIMIVIAALLVFSLFTVWVIRDTTLKVVSPLTNASQSLSTQVAAVLHPTPTILPDPVTIIHEVRSLARLETISYSVEKVIRAENGQQVFNFLFGDKLIFVAHGYVIAGIDLAKMESENLWIKDGALYVSMPPAEIFVATLDNNQSYVFDRDTGLLTKGDFELETKARQAAESEIRNAALEDGILDQATVNAENYLSRLFTQLGYPEVIFVSE